MKPNFPKRIPVYLKPSSLDKTTNKLFEENKMLTKQIKKLIETQLFYWENGFQNTLPDSNFIKKEVKPQFYPLDETSYHPKERRLTMDHLRKIKETGQFSVRSNVKGLPYKWKITSLLTTGKEYEKNVLRWWMSMAFTFIRKFKQLHFPKFSDFDDLLDLLHNHPHQLFLHGIV